MTRVRLCRSLMALCLLLLSKAGAFAQNPPQPSQTQFPEPSIRLNSNLVFLDVTVVDKKGRPVAKGLTRDDFTITEDKQQQKIFSFETPAEHNAGAKPSEKNPDARPPLNIIVLDLLNSSFADISYIRYSVNRFLNQQPDILKSPAELMVIRDFTFEMLQGYTRKKSDLLYALDHLPAFNPFERNLPAFSIERFGQSADALRQIALENKGIPGRKNVIWVGPGGPGINTGLLPPPNVAEIERYVHASANLLVDSRISLFLIYPGLNAHGGVMSKSVSEADMTIGESDPFADDINFGILVNDTGGKLFYNRNDVDAEIATSEDLGSEYYTLTYQPQSVPPDGKFRRIRVTLRNPNLRAITKAGYFAPDKDHPEDPRENAIAQIAEASQANVPFTALPLRIESIVRHPDARTAEVTVLARTPDLGWLPAGQGSSASLILAATALDSNRMIVASKLERLQFGSSNPDPSNQPAQNARASVTVQMPKSTRSIRVVLRTDEGGRIGAVELDRKAIAAAPQAPTPDPRLAPKTAAPPAKPAPE